MTQTPKVKCAKEFYEPLSHMRHCKHWGILFEEGKHWCRQHAPSTKAAKEAAWSEKWAQQGMERRVAEQRTTAKEAAYAACQAAGLSTEALQAGVIEDLIAALRALAERMELLLKDPVTHRMVMGTVLTDEKDLYAWQAATIVLRNARSEGVQP